MADLAALTLQLADALEELSLRWCWCHTGPCTNPGCVRVRDLVAAGRAAASEHAGQLASVEAAYAAGRAAVVDGAVEQFTVLYHGRDDNGYRFTTSTRALEVAATAREQGDRQAHAAHRYVTEWQPVETPDTHPADRAQADAQLIVARANSTVHLAEALIRESHANVHLVTPADVMVISGFRGGFDEITAEVLEGVHTELRKGGIRYLLMFEDEVDLSKLTAADLCAALAALEEPTRSAADSEADV